MALGAEAFTVLAVLEARDKATQVYERVQAAVDRFSGAMKSAADSATAAGVKIDESFLQTASGADALDLATAKVQSAKARATAATQAQADAERELLAAQEQAAVVSDGDAAATDRLAAAGKRLAVTQKAARDATAALKTAQAEQAGIADLQAGVAGKAAESAASSGAKLSGLASSVGKIGLGMDLAGGLMVKAAAGFQSSTTVLETSGGEAASQMAAVRQGILNLSASTGTALEPLVNGMYMVGSAGITGGAGLRVLQAAAQGAKAEGADLGTVSNALTTVLTDYNIKVRDTADGQKAANAVMNQMIAVVSSGKTTTEALAGSLSAVLPVASSAKIGFDQVGGAMATMTAQGMSAQQSAQDLAHTISALQNPNAVAVKEMQAMGLNANDVSKNLGRQGLTGTLAQLTQAITSHMGPAGLVLQNAFASSSAAAKDANAMISQMPASLQKLAQGYLNGSVTAKQWTADLKGLPPIQAKLMTQFAGVADKTHTFNSLLASGSPAAQTYNAALSKMMGGQTGLTTALMLTGTHLSTFQSNVAKVSDASKRAGSSVDGWAQIQGNFNQKLAEAKQSVEAMGITIGTALLPTVTKIADAVLKVVTPVTKWIQEHQHLTGVIFASLAGLFSFVGAVNLGAKAFGAVSKAFGTVGKAFSGTVGLIGKVATGIGKIPGLVASAWSGISSAASTLAGFASNAASWAANAAQVAAGWVKTGAQAALAAGKFLVLKGAQIATAAASGIATAAQWAFNAAMDANPITLVIIAIVALVAIFVVLWNKCSAFRNFWKALWHDIEAAARVVFEALKAAFRDVARVFEAEFHVIAALAKADWDLTLAVFRIALDVIKAVMDGIVTAVQAAWHLIVGIFELEVHLVEAAVSWFISLPGKFAGWMRDVGSAVSKGVHDVIAFFAALPGKIVSAIGSVGSLLLGKGTDILNGLWSGIKNIWGTVTGFFKGLGSTIEGWLSDAGTWLVNIGKNVVGGLWSGIKSAAGGLKNDVKSIAGDVTGFFTSGFGIFSPSRLMRDRVGKFIPPGIALGITDNLGVLKKAAGIAANVTVTAAQAGIGGAGSGVHIPAPVAAAGGGVVNLHFDLRGATVSNEQAARNLVNQIGGVVAKQMFAQGGYKLQTM